jgi:transcription termination/antitermination protein NusG
MTMEDTSENTGTTPDNEENTTIPDEEQTSAILAPPVEEAGAQSEEPPVVEAGEESLEPEAVEEEPPEEPAAEAAEEPAAEAAEEPAVEAAEKPAAEAAEEPAAEAAEEPAVEAAEEPAAKKPKRKAKQSAGEPDGNGAGADPFRGPGDWYVIHTYAGYENKVKTNLQTRIQTMQMQEKIFDVQIPMEDVMEIKGGKKQVVQKKVFPGYLLVKMVYDDDSWVCVRNTPGVTGFVSSGTGQKPTPLSRREVEKILTVEKEETKKPAFRLDFEEGDVVRIISGPFADFNGTISDINVAQSKVRVMVNIFDRETPVELSFDQVARV